MSRHVSLTLSLALAFGLSACEKQVEKPLLERAKCSTDGQTACVATESYPAVASAPIQAVADSIPVGISLGGVAGTLADCTTDGGTNCVTSPAYPSVAKADLAATNFASGSTVGGVTGTLAPACTADGQTDCLTTTVYKSLNKAGVTTWDIRKGKTVGGIDGSLSFLDNGANLTLFNRIAGTASNSSTSVADVFDTIDDYNNGLGTVPAVFPAAFPVPGSNWLRDSGSDTDTNGACNGSEQCVYKDQITGQYWAKDDATTRTWENAIIYCDGLSYGGYTDWRLPTQKELAQAVVDRIASVATALGIGNANYISSTSASDTPTGNSNALNLFTGSELKNIDKLVGARNICTR